MNELFLTNPEEKKRIHTKLLKGMRVPMFKYQLVVVYFMLSRSFEENGDLEGGFIGDDPGLGKTATSIAFIVTTRLLLRAHDHWKEHPEKHL
jgi:hypothetical protein